MTTELLADAPPKPVSTSRPIRVAWTILQLAAVGVGGTVILTFLLALFAVGIGLLPALGFGLLLLVAFVYCLYAAAWLETARVEGAYGLGLPDLVAVGRTRPGFGGWLSSLLRQVIEPRMWLAIANLAVTTILGCVVLSLFSGMLHSATIALAPFTVDAPALSIAGIRVSTSWAVATGIVLVVLAAGAIIGIALLQGLITRAIMVPSREAQLTAAAHASQTQARAFDAQRAGAVRAADLERTRIERDLHDGVQPRLVSVGMTLGLAKQKLDTDPATARSLIDEAHTSTKAAITELRQLARGIHASVLDDRGLDAALSALAGRSHIPVHLDVRMDGRCSRDAEAAVYFAIAESLTNAAKHSRASECRVSVRVREDRTLWARVEDNGVGGASVIPGGGLDGITNRVLSAGGTFRLESPVGGPTALEVTVPCAS